MRWRFIDGVENFEAWTCIRGRKSVSLEEYSLLESQGRKGCFPESLVLESCVQLVRWLVVVSSDFQQSCTLSEVEQFAFEGGTNPGETLLMCARVLSRQKEALEVECEVLIGDRRYGHGKIKLSIVQLKEIAVAEDAEILWRELYAKA